MWGVSESFQGAGGDSQQSRVQNHGDCQGEHRKQVGKDVQALARSIIGKGVDKILSHEWPTGIRFVNVACVDGAITGTGQSVRLQPEG